MTARKLKRMQLSSQQGMKWQGACLLRTDCCKDLREIPTTSVATVALAFPEEHVVQDKEGTGFLVSEAAIIRLQRVRGRIENGRRSTPEGKVLIRAFVGRVGDEAIVDLPDAEIEKIVLADLAKL